MKKNNHPSKASSIIIALFFITVFFSGCSIWLNFTTYFNLYYNASRKFDEAEAQIKLQKKELFTLNDVKGASGNKSLTEVIEKLSRLLQFYSESSYVDDALLMIGKSFYYQGEFQKALRKFNELLTKYPESDLLLETKLWVGKANFRAKNYDEGNKILDEVKETATNENETDILTQSFIEQVSYLITMENYNEAIDAATKLIEISGDDEMNALVKFELGKLYLKIDQPQNAANSFADVQNYSPDFETDFNSRLEYGKVQRQLGNAQSALEIFENIKSKSLYNEYLDQTELQIGLALMDLKRPEDAFNQLTLVDTTYKQSQSVGVARYYLGEIMVNDYKNFDSANVYYSKATSSSAPPEILESAKKKNLLLNKYDNLRTAISQTYRQLVYLENPEEFIKDSVAFAVEQNKIDSLNNSKKLLKDEENASNTSSRNRRNTEIEEKKVQPQTSKLKQPIRPKISSDSIHSIISKNEYELAGLFFTEFNQFDSAFYYYSKILKDHPKCPYIGRTIYALGAYYETLNQKDKADSLFEIVYNNYKNESIVNAAATKLKKPIIIINYDPADEQYLEAEKKLKEEKFNEAIVAFKNIYEKYPKSSFAPKALYAQGWILENKLMSLDSAAVIYDSLSSKYAGTQYAAIVIPKLSEYKGEQNRKRTEQDSIKMKRELKNVQPEKRDSISALTAPKKEPINKDQEGLKNVSIDKDIKEIEISAPITPPVIDSLKNKNIENIKEENQINQPDSLKNKPQAL